MTLITLMVLNIVQYRRRQDDDDTNITGLGQYQSNFINLLITMMMPKYLGKKLLQRFLTLNRDLIII